MNHISCDLKASGNTGGLHEISYQIRKGLVCLMDDLIVSTVDPLYTFYKHLLISVKHGSCNRCQHINIYVIPQPVSLPFSHLGMLSL